MAERKPGPVKPPVIDLTARPAQSEDSTTGKPAEAGSARPEGWGVAAAARPSEAPAAEPSETKPGEAKSADTKPSDAKPSDIKPTGAKPDTAKPEASARLAPAAAPSGAQPAAASEATAPAQVNLWPAMGGAVLGGAILGALLSYGVASMGWLPTLPSPQQSAAMASLTGRVSAIESKITEANSTDTAAIQKLQQTVTELQSTPAPAATDLGPVNEQLKTLSSRIDALGAGASSADAGAIAATLKELRADLTALDGKISALGDRQAKSDTALSGLSDTVSGLSGEVNATKSALAKQAADTTLRQQSDALRLPLLVSSLEDAFATGRPYADELKTLATIAPDVAVPPSVGSYAAKGLPQPQAMGRELQTAIPAMLAAVPAPANAGWQDQASSWVRGLLAIRPTGEIGGDSPEALVSQLESAIARSDFKAALDTMSRLPEPMRNAAGPLPGELAAAADAGQLLAELRTKALSAGTGARS